MQDRHIGDVRVTRIEEQMGPGFPAKDFFPEFEAETFAAEQHWLAPNYYQPESGRVIASIHSWLVRTGKYTVLIDSCSGFRTGQIVTREIIDCHSINVVIALLI